MISLTRRLSTRVVLMTLALIWGVASVSAQSVLVIWDSPENAAIFQNIFEDAGYQVTLSDTAEPGYTGANPSPFGHDVVVHLNADDGAWETEMSQAGQSALVGYVASGGGYIGGEWNAWEVRTHQRMLSMLDLIPMVGLDNGTYGSIVASVAAGAESHPIFAGIPSTFTYSGWRIASVPREYTDSLVFTLLTDNLNNAVLVERVYGAGRVIAFNHAAAYRTNGSAEAIDNATIQQLYVNAVAYASGGGATNPVGSIYGIGGAGFNTRPIVDFASLAAQATVQSTPLSATDKSILAQSISTILLQKVLPGYPEHAAELYYDYNNPVFNDNNGNGLTVSL
ncbi:MAG: hypothetical protein O3A46_01520, partial [Candidatus Poribacteria bacterium]|nr:hypothetical protein [Candidatus Poribacteria bacterium]